MATSMQNIHHKTQKKLSEWFAEMFLMVDAILTRNDLKVQKVFLTDRCGQNRKRI